MAGIWRVLGFFSGGMFNSLFSRLQYLGVIFFIIILIFTSVRTDESFFGLLGARVFSADADLKTNTEIYIEQNGGFLNFLNMLGSLFFIWFMLRIFFLAIAWSPFSNKSMSFVNLIGAFVLFAGIQVVYTAITFKEVGIPFAGLLFFIMNLKNLPNPFRGGTIAETLTKENLNETISNMTNTLENVTIRNETITQNSSFWDRFIPNIRLNNPLK